MSHIKFSSKAPNFVGPALYVCVCIYISYLEFIVYTIQQNKDAAI